tara:strand:+ start:391 stop:708 length:318 start_codon:yes stop_codon:yes gene_type:complete
MVNRLYNKQISPKGYDEGGQVKKISTINIPKGYHPMRGLEIEGRIRRGDTKKEIFSEHKKLKENLFKKGVKPSQIIKLDDEFNKRYDRTVKRIKRFKKSMRKKDD